MRRVRGSLARSAATKRLPTRAKGTDVAVRYDIAFAPEKGRWYLDASWQRPSQALATLEQLRGHRLMAVDVNAAHLAAMVVDPSGNPLGRPLTVPLK